MFALVLTVALATGGVFPGLAEAHGPVAPVALDYLARVGSLPAGLEAKVVDGDQRMWLQAPPGETVLVLDYAGAPYLRFSRSGVEVNHNSAMWYLNQTPFALTPPAGLGRRTPPKWESVGGGHEYGWHDGRLHALATVALNPGASFVGTWRIPILVDGRSSAISGGCGMRCAVDRLVLADRGAAVVRAGGVAGQAMRSSIGGSRAARVRCAGGDRGCRAGPAASRAAVGVGVSACRAGSHSGVRAVGLFPGRLRACWRLHLLRDRRRRLWEGFGLIPTLTNGFVLIALPAFVARVAAVVALGTAAGIDPADVPPVRLAG